jgi:succinate dehydrogenase / fumarate reductase cytochrome b subunit
MAITGVFLVVFLVVHLTINLFLFVSPELFNEGSHFMATNPLIQVMQYVLAAGFIVHIVMGFKLTLQNKAARPIGYAYENAAVSSSWASRNMIITGGLILVFLVLHMRHFFYEIKFTDNVTDDYMLVTSLFSIWYFALFYVLAFVGLGIHLNHGFQSAFQSIGWKNSKWKGIMQLVGTLYSIFIAVGFSSIAIWFFLNPVN